MTQAKHFDRTLIPQPMCRCDHGLSAHRRLNGACEGIFFDQRQDNRAMSDGQLCDCTRFRVQR